MLSSFINYYYLCVTPPDQVSFTIRDSHSTENFVVVRDGVIGRSNGGINRRWMYGADFDSFVSASIPYSRWLAMKRVIKLCNNDTAPKRGEAGYDPSYKFDKIYNTIIRNTNVIKGAADLDQCGDKTTWGHGGYVEAGTGLVGRIMEKPVISKGG